ncbi:Rpn family recombination-promoting nuclease/putative transposase [Clostridium sulfidigenes]|uniref:Rpn family recombination-promoting nuclease/putative transposase n=1 Tax=Clostridium sulfidigenes TaxID=318464 RepID=UPI003F8A315B
MNKLLNPKNDVVFQKIFGVKENEKLLISFLNSVLEPMGNGKIKSITLEEKALNVSLIASEKLSILDINVTTENSTHINVEIQLINQYNMIRRTIFYLSKMILKQLVKGDNYNQLNKTITINILDFDYINDEKFHSSYHLYEDMTKKLLSDIVEIHFIELKKFEKSKKDYNNKLHRWLSFLINPEGKEIDIMKKEDTEIKEAMDVLYNISGDKELIQLADMRDKAIRDEKSRLQGARDEGREEGKKEGKIEGKIEGIKQGARDALAKSTIKLLRKKFKDIPENIIESILKLSLEKIEKINEDLFDIESIEELKKYI